MPELPANYKTLTDAALLERLALHDEFAFLAIYQRYAESLYQTAFKRLPVAHKAEDMVQDVFISLYRNLYSAHNINNLKAWLFACLRNQILNEIRNLHTHRRHDMQIAAQAALTTFAHSEYDLKKLETQFHQALKQLTERCRQVFLMSRMENLPNKKIAERLNISVHGVEKHVTTALRIMKKELNKQAPGIIIFLLLVQKFLPL